MKKILLITLLPLSLLMAGSFVMSKGKPLIKTEITNSIEIEETPLEIEETPLEIETETYDKTIIINSLSELEQAVKNTTISTKIILENGIYKDLNVVQLKDNSAPILIVAKNYNAVQIQRNLEIFGNNITIKGILFNGGYNNGSKDGLGGCIYNFGNDNRVTKCTWDDSKARRWMYSIKGDRFELDHCIFKNKYNNKDYTQAITTAIYSYQDSDHPSKHKIHNNYWFNIQKGKTSNGYESLIIYATTHDNDQPAYQTGPNHGVICEYNLFENCDGEFEVLSNKTIGTKIRYNTFKNSNGGLTLRLGGDTEVSYNYILNDDPNDTIAYGMRIMCKNQHVHHNYINIKNTSIPAMEVYNGDNTKYAEAKNFNIHDNWIQGGSVVLRFGRTIKDTNDISANGILNNNILIQDGAKQNIQINTNRISLTKIISENNKYFGVKGDTIPGFSHLDTKPEMPNFINLLTSNNVGVNTP